jgi:hypothetical protein
MSNVETRPLESPQIGGFEEETPPHFEKGIRGPVISFGPSDLFVQRTIADMDDGSRDVCEGSEKICHQLFSEGIVFHDSPEKEILVHLERVLAADDHVVEFFLGICLSGELRINQTEFQMKLPYGQKSNGCHDIVSFSLVGILDIPDFVPVKVIHTEKKLIRDLARSYEPGAACAEPFFLPDLGGVSVSEQDHRASRKKESQVQRVIRFVKAAGLIIDLAAVDHRFQPLDNAGSGIEHAHDS